MGLPDPPELGASALPAGTFQDQVVIVTGGGTGLGKAMAGSLPDVSPAATRYNP